MTIKNIEKKCYICGIEDPILEGHHVQPQSKGGSEGPVVQLCPRCHAGIHFEAKARLSKKEKILFQPHLRDKAEPLIQAIMFSEKLEGPTTKVILNIPKEIHFKMHRLKRDKGFKNLETFIILILSKICGIGERQ